MPGHYMDERPDGIIRVREEITSTESISHRAFNRSKPWASHF